MNKKVQKTKKSILATSVLSLFAFSLLGMGVASLNPADNVYAETDPYAIFSSSITGETSFGDQKVYYVGSETDTTKTGSCPDNNLTAGDELTVTYKVAETSGFNGAVLKIDYPDNLVVKSITTTLSDANIQNFAYSADTKTSTFDKTNPVIVMNSLGEDGALAGITGETDLFTVTYVLTDTFTTGYTFNVTADQLYLVAGATGVEDVSLTPSNATTVTQLIVRSQPTITIEESQTMEYDGTAAGIEKADAFDNKNHTIEYTTTATNTISATYAGANITEGSAIDAGDYSVTLTAEPTLTEYGVSATQTFTIKQATSVDTFKLSNIIIQDYEAPYNPNTKITLKDSVSSKNYDLAKLLRPTSSGIKFQKSGATTPTSSVTNVADSGDYTLVLVFNSKNITLEDDLGAGWVIDTSSGYKRATLENALHVNITKVKLAQPILSYNDSTAMFYSVSTDKNGVKITGSASYTVDNGGQIEYDSSYSRYKIIKSSLSKVDKYTIIAVPSDTANYENSDPVYTLATKIVTFKPGVYDEKISRETQPELPETMYAFCGKEVRVSSPTLKNHTFDKWEYDKDVTIRYVGSLPLYYTITDDTEFTACWKPVSSQSSILDVTYYYSVDGVLQTTPLATVTFYSNDTTYDIEKLMPKVSASVWYSTNNVTWYKEIGCSTIVDNSFTSYRSAGTQVADKTTLNLYGYANFGIGLGDVNGDGSVDAKDLTAYRKVLVGGYNIKAVEKNNEWATVTAPAFAQNSEVDFLKKVADVNVKNDGSAFAPDNALDIRDVCTIAMAIAGGYGNLSVNNNTYGNNEITLNSTVDGTFDLNILKNKITDSITSVVFATDNNVAGKSIFSLGETLTEGLKVVGYVEGTTLYIKNLTGGKIVAPENLSHLFQNKGSLKSVDFSGLDTSNVTEMGGLFSDTMQIESITFGSNFDTSKVKSMQFMFEGCSSLTELDLSMFNTSNATNMQYMFQGCSSLTELDLSSFDTAKVTNMRNMFQGCSSLTELDLSSFDTAMVTDMQYMFEGCSSLTELDLSSFDTAKLVSVGHMFENDTNLKTIYVSDKFVTTAVTSSTSMFASCSSLVGGNGTTYYFTGLTYARIDAEGTPGYFTDIADKPQN